MSVRTRNAIGLLSKIDHALEVADKKHSFENGLNIAKQVAGLLGIDDAPEVLKSFPRLKTNPSWTKNAPDYEDRKASFALAENNERNIDFKLYWVTKPAKRIISNLVALTPNFEDEAFYSNKSVGIDFILPDKADRLVIVLSSNYKIRTLEIHRHLSNTQKKIFEKWAQEFDFSNKAQVHKVLWDSFDIQPLNKEFYLEISSFFNELVQHLEKENILDKKHRSQFVNRLIGRIIFCWFLRKKEMISEEGGYFETEGKPATEYYSKKLEELFFKVLNTSLDERGFGIDDKTPFLNGGLFEEKESDLAGRGELSFPPDYFDRFYLFLNRYNFTTDESTSDFQQVAIDPEMLGRIFENLLAEEIEETGEQARKAKGAFYTPREIVEYMCRESLRAYVSERLGDDARKGEVLQLLFDKREHELDPKSVSGKLASYKNRIIEALDAIKIIDPACGSGAFPIGMLQIMLTIYERLDARLDHYKTKLTIIKNNIFGVDIEPMAVEISRLRTWLSLVVDSVIKPSEKNKGIEELPNLDFKFICANSLVPLEEEEGLFDNKQMAEQMQAIRERYFKTNSQRIKDKMKRDFEELLKKNQSMFASAKQKQLLTYHPFDSDNVADFLDVRFMFGVTDGFDLVIGNPPYVEARNSKLFTDNLKIKYQKAVAKRLGARKEYITRGADLLIYFFELAISLLSEKGTNTFITQNAWLGTDYGKKFQDLLLSFGLEIATVDSDIKHFDATCAPNINTVITFFKKNNGAGNVHFNTVNIGINVGEIDEKRNKTFSVDDPLLKHKWGVLFKSPENILSLINLLLKKGSFSGYSIGQGVNLTKDYLVPLDVCKSLNLNKNVYPILTNDEGAPFVVTQTKKCLVTESALNAQTKKEFKNLGYKLFELSKGRKTPSLILPRGLGRYYAAINQIDAYSASGVEVYVDDEDLINNIWCFLNSTIGYLIREISGRTNLGGGMLKAEATDLKYFPLNCDFKQAKRIGSIINDLSLKQSASMAKLILEPFHIEIDDIVFGYFGIQDSERKKIQSTLIELVASREKKAKT
jgi:hypothetical protein